MSSACRQDGKKINACGILVDKHLGKMFILNTEEMI
jgi:hypothetical protein